MRSTEFLSAQKNGLAFNYVTEHLDIDATDTPLLIRANSAGYDMYSEVLYIHSDTETEIEVHVGTDSALAATGTVVSAAGFNRLKSVSAPAVAYADETALSQGTVIVRKRVKADTDLEIDFGGALQLDYLKFIAVDVTAETGELQLDWWVFFKTH